MDDKLTERKAQNGQPVAVINGIHLCSTFNPDREAERWVERHREMFCGCPIVLLGLGCGYHALEVAARTEQRVIVFERRAELINWFYKTSKRQFPHLSIYHVDADSHGKKMDRVFSLLGQPYMLKVNPYSMRLDAEIYTMLADLLLGRKKDAFKFQLARRPDLRRFFDRAKIDHPGHKYLMSFPVVQEKLTNQELNSREAEIWRALGELVK